MARDLLVIGSAQMQLIGNSTVPEQVHLLAIKGHTVLQEEAGLGEVGIENAVPQILLRLAQLVPKLVQRLQTDYSQLPIPSDR